MRVTRLYLETRLSEGIDLDLELEQSHYLGNVLRMAEGASLQVFNAECGEYRATISALKKSKASIVIEQKIADYTAPPLKIHLILGISRGDRMDYAIQKSVELGVGSITPMYSEFGEVRFKQADRLQRKLQHWQRIAISAAEQCGRLDVPKIGEPKEFGHCLNRDADENTVLFEPDANESLQDIAINASVTVVVGPEGGFSTTELDAARQSTNCHLVKLGPRVLRTETAPVVALSVIQQLYGDF
ncbi:MAG: 16S rRNA (uracil(1498)-N(3))-methyltransferase [Gammaproteobacteria bacterium]